MVVKVCVGSSCHLKGSYDIIEAFKSLMVEYGVEDKIELKATFCLGKCKEGVLAVADEILLHHVSPENVRNIFETEVLPKVKAE